MKSKLKQVKPRLKLIYIARNGHKVAKKFISSILMISRYIISTFLLF